MNDNSIQCIKCRYKLIPSFQASIAERGHYFKIEYLERIDIELEMGILHMFDKKGDTVNDDDMRDIDDKLMNIQ